MQEETQKENLIETPLQDFSETQAYSGTADFGKKEAVDETLEELLQEKRAKGVVTKKNSGFKRFLLTVSYPFRIPFLFILSKISSKMKTPLMVKMLILFSSMFALLLIGYAVFILVTVSSNVRGDPNHEGLVTQLIIFTAVIGALAVILFTALTGVISSIMLQPIRKITQEIDDLTAEDLSKRLAPVDTQDEFLELTNRINWMLDDIETTFKRQESFISDASHELKTPIAVVAGYANLLKRWGSKNEEILHESIDAIRRESENMQHIVEQLLLLAKIGQIHTQITTFDVHVVLSEIIDGYKLLHDTHDVTYNGGEALLINTDRNLLIELVRILTDNAIRYTAKGGQVAVSAFCEEGYDLKIVVSDTGMGIAEKDLPMIFDRFFRCDRARGRESGGTGLGLTIAKSIADALNGVLEVESQEGVGTTFSFTLY